MFVQLLKQLYVLLFCAVRSPVYQSSTRRRSIKHNATSLPRVDKLHERVVLNLKQFSSKSRNLSLRSIASSLVRGSCLTEAIIIQQLDNIYSCFIAPQFDRYEDKIKGCILNKRGLGSQGRGHIWRYTKYPALHPLTTPLLLIDVYC